MIAADPLSATVYGGMIGSLIGRVKAIGSRCASLFFYAIIRGR